MALITLFSAKGAPGVSTTAMLLASLWPRQSLLVDADPLGGDIALRLPDVSGGPLSRERGLISLLPAARHGLTPQVLTQHVQTALGGQPVIVGLDGPEQADAVGTLWPVLARAFADVPDTDVIVDAGHLATRAPHHALLDSSSVVVCVYRPQLPSVVHTRSRLESLTEVLAFLPARTGVLAVATERERQDVETSAARLRDELDWVHDFGTIAWDPKGAEMFDGRDVLRPERTLIARSGRGVATALFDRIATDAMLADDQGQDDDGAAPGPDQDGIPGQPGTRRGARRRGATLAGLGRRGRQSS